MKLHHVKQDCHANGPIPSLVDGSRLTSLRADGFQDGRRFGWSDGPEEPFDPVRYKEIFAETD